MVHDKGEIFLRSSPPKESETIKNQALKIDNLEDRIIEYVKALKKLSDQVKQLNRYIVNQVGIIDEKENTINLLSAELQVFRDRQVKLYEEIRRLENECS